MSQNGFWKRPFSEKYLVFRILLWICFIRGLLKLVRVGRLRKILGFIFFRRIFIGTVPSLSQIRWAFDSIAHQWPEFSQCLERALAAEAICRQSGYSVNFKIGVLKPGQKIFQAHAWVEYQDQVIINVDRQTRYQPLWGSGP